MEIRAMPLDYRVISLGTLAVNTLWQEGGPVRTPHATTSLVLADPCRILINPGLPAQVLHARLGERSPVQPEEVTHVFMTSLAGDHRRGLGGFPNAVWLAHEPELTHARTRLQQELDEVRNHADEETVALCEARLAPLERIGEAPDQIVQGVDLFPLPGVTPGTCGLLLSQPRATVLIAGDAVATAEHMEQGKVLQSSEDLEQARESFREAIEIADIIIPGRDNMLVR
ncbi:MAG: MBL fold metallo-hydrolase [Planctomycetota bacterium]|nr:MBL fold metallo-hydrolase [Planctomycetota bacterium]